MTVAAPPRPPQVRESTEHDPGEALIKEAQQRARRRRWLYGGAAGVVLAVAAVAGFVILPSSPSPPNGAPRNVPTPPGATAVQAPDPGSPLIASWGRMHTGYAFIYGDGRVIWYPDRGVAVDADGKVPHILGIFPPGSNRSVPFSKFKYKVIERRLSPLGLDLARAGQLDPKLLLLSTIYDHIPREIQPTIDPSRWPVPDHPYLREELWAEPTARVWEPSRYAICSRDNGDRINATDVLDELPAPVEALLDGKERTYDPSVGTANWYAVPGWPLDAAPVPLGTYKAGPPPRCFEVTAAESSTIYQTLRANGQIIDPSGRTTTPLNWSARAGRVVLSPLAVYPHGQPVPWGG